MNWDAIDWQALERLRQSYLGGTAGGADYWRSERDLDSYNQTFAQRIGWKWDYVFEELKRRGWTPPKAEVLDWGCGSGVAGRAFVDHFGADTVSGLRVWDRSPLAMGFAQRTARKKFGKLPVETGLTDAPQILLLSHVLTELTPDQTDELANYAAKADVVIWVEPGMYEASLTLIAVRERLRSQFNVVAPCTHGEQCGILAPGNDRDWCHHFATPPSAIFTDPDWGKFAHMMGIDLRALPVSFLVLDKRPQPPALPHCFRVIGRVRVYKAHALLQACDVTGVKDYELHKRNHPAEFKRIKKGEIEPLPQWETEGDKVTKVLGPVGSGADESVDGDDA